MLTLLDDLRFTVRQLRRAPGFTMTVIATLTLAVTANVMVYGIANGLVFRRLPVPTPKQVVQVQNPGFAGISFSYPNYVDLRERTSRTFSTLAAARFTRFAIGLDGVEQPVWGFLVSGNYFDMLGIDPQLGRLLRPSDDVSVNGSNAMVLSDRCWRLRFHADPAVVGKVVPIGKIPFVVVGVAPRSFYGTEKFYAPDAWLPFHDGPEIDSGGDFESRGSTNAWVYGRLHSGVTREQADADLQRVSAQMAQQYPAEDQGTAWRTAEVGLLGDVLGRPVHGFVAGVAALALLVLIAACANLGVLFSSRTADRARELGIRLAIGSSRQRILRQLAVESILVSLLGGAAAAMLAKLLLRAISEWQPPTELPLQLLVEADWRVYLASLLLALVTGLLFGALSARQLWRTDLNKVMRTAGSTALADRSLVRSGMLVVQIALCCLLVTASFVAFRGLQRTFTLPLGFDPRGVTLATVDVQLAGYRWPQQVVVQQRLLNAVKAIPGVTMAAYSGNQPLSLNTNSDDVYAPGTTRFDQSHVRSTAMVYSVSPDYFAATGTTLLFGRAFTVHDDTPSPKVAILNETLARQLFGTADAVGKRYPTSNGTETEVVGVVRDGKYLSLSEEPTAALFKPILQYPDRTAVLIARSQRNPAEMSAAIRKAVAGVDSNIPIFNISSWPDALEIVTFPARAATLALGIMGVLAAMLAATGIFGVASYTVAQRLRELGIRVALGARLSGVLHAALGRTFVLMATGAAIGLVMGVASTRLLAGIVYHASAHDPLVLAAVVLVMLSLGLLASAFPARRAARVQPADLLRES